ncbi:MAG: sodium:proton antiporter [Clostridiales bacterium]|nr:sodium:proton antiporter [Clostridiales bacterium]
MKLWQNLPLFLIVLPLMCAVICSVLKGKAARGVMTALASFACVAMSVILLMTAGQGKSYIYVMGEVGAPFGNELKIGVIEGLMGLGFSLVLLFSILGGWRKLTKDVAPQRMNLYATMVCLLVSAMMAITFTNDLFTAYVFIEITTIAACALICSTNKGRTFFAATRYMIMNLLGSGLFLLGLSILYCITGHLLFPQLEESVKALMAKGEYKIPLSLAAVLMTLGVGVKSALYPFHTWLPNAYASATPTSSALLSSLISKMYIFLLIKIFFRAAGAEIFAQGIGDVLFVFSLVGIILGSVDAIREHSMSRMVAYSSVSQIGYIFLGISLGTEAGMAAALFHILAHSAAKSMLFLSANKLREVSGGSDAFRDIRASGLRAPLAGLAFGVGACSLVGVPLLGGFSSKVYLAQAGLLLGDWRTTVLLLTLALSTVLNVAYMLRTTLTLYRPGQRYPLTKSPLAKDAPFTGAMIALVLINIVLGVGGGRVMELIYQGIAMFN